MGKGRNSISLAGERLVKGLLRTVGLDLKWYHSHRPELWSDEGDFLELFSQIEGRTVVGRERCFMLYQWAKYASLRDGEMAEVGVYKGGTAKLISKVCAGKELHLFDTFSGMPTVDANVDDHREGDFADTSEEGVREFLGDCKNVHFHAGFFPDTAEPVKDCRFSLVYVDVDIYSSVKACLEFFYHRLTPGGVMVFDDYMSPSCAGVKKALDDFLADKKEEEISTVRSQCIMIKA